MEEIDRTLLFLDFDSVGCQLRQALFQLGQLMEMGRKQRAGSNAVVDMLDHGLGNGHAVKGAGPST